MTQAMICFPEHSGAGSTGNVKAARNVTQGRGQALCDGEGCRAEAQPVDGWLFVGGDGEPRHYCRACLARSLQGLRAPAAT